MSKLKIKKQINLLYISSVINNLSITGAWVAILAARGFSLVEIGFAETIFHITSLLFEIPSGAIADVLGRKKSLVLSSIMSALACLIMAMTDNFAGVAVSFVFTALGYNFASGSGDALAYDSLKQVGEEERYEKYASNQLILYRITSGLSTLCAGVALALGYRWSYLISVFSHLIALFVILGLKEVPHTDEADAEASPGDETKTADAEHESGAGKPGNRNILLRMGDTFVSSIRFLWHNKKAAALMFSNSLVGAFDILLLFFLQSKLRESGLSDRWLGIALLIMEMGGILGARWILRMKKCRYAFVFTLCTLIVLSGLLLEHTGLAAVMTLGGFLSAAADDALQIRTDAKLQDMFSSAQRATLISIHSFTFSIIMIVLSPLAGWIFTLW